MTDSEQPPEMALIERLRLAPPKRSVAKAAKAAGISEGRWRQLAKGYQQVTAETRVIQKAPDDTLARMAAAVGASADDIEDAGRMQAAEIMRKTEQHPGRGPGVPTPEAAPPHDAHFARAERLLQHSRNSVAHGDYLGAVHGLEGAQSTVELLIDRISDLATGGEGYGLEDQAQSDAQGEAVEVEEVKSPDDSELARAMVAGAATSAARISGASPEHIAVVRDDDPENPEQVSR